MQMEIMLLQNKKGVILTRQPEVIKDNLYVTFSNAPENATAIIENKAGNSIYKLLEDYTCAIPSDFLDAEVKITIAVLDGVHNCDKWFCESIRAMLVNGEILVCPGDNDLPGEMAKAQIEIDKLQTGFNKITKDYAELNEKLEKLLNGYDIT